MSDNDRPHSSAGLFKRLERQFLISIAFGIIVFLALTIYAHFGELRDAFSSFNFIYIPLILFLAFGNYLIRFLRWDFYLRTLQIGISGKNSFIVFMSGLTMSVTPGKFGELLKSYLLKKLQDIPVSKTAPIVFAERFTDFIALVILCVSGVLVFHHGITILFISIGITLIFLIILGNEKFALKLISMIGRFSKLNNMSLKFSEMYTHTQVLLRSRELIIGTVIGVLSWSCECIAFYFLFYGFHLTLPIFDAFFIYSFATIAGAISMLPGGVGATEGSITFLLKTKGIPLATGVAATFIIRVCTLWFALVVGLIFLFIFKERFEGVEEYMDINNA